MSKMSLAPYLYFNGQCKEAMEFYKDVFGGDLTLQTMGDIPEEVREQAGNPDKDRIMHARLEAEGFTVLGSDTAKASDKAAKIELSIMGDDEERLTKIFNSLSEGGSVFMPLAKQFWGDTFGSLTDKYGIQWVVNIEAQKQ
jgi:PhnB protein